MTLVCLAAAFGSLCAQAKAQPPIQTIPSATAASRPEPNDFSGRYERTQAASGVLWTLVLDSDGTAQVLANGRPAADSSGQIAIFRYRVSGKQLYLRDSRTQREELFGTFHDSTLTTVRGWRYEKRR